MPLPPTPIPPGASAGGRRAFLALSGLLLAALTLQVTLAGLGLMHRATYWAYHAGFAHAFDFLPLVLVVVAAVGRLGTPLVLFPALLQAQVFAQYAFVALRPGAVAALHVVNAVGMVALTLHLHARARRLGTTPPPCAHAAAPAPAGHARGQANRMRTHLPSDRMRRPE